MGRLARITPLLVATLLLGCEGMIEPVEDEAEVTLQEATNLTPVIESIGQDSGPSEGGTAVFVRGDNFAPDVEVYFGNTPATEVTRLSRQSIRATAPAHVPGLVDVEVANPLFSAVRSGGFTFTAPPTAAVFPLQRSELFALPGETVTLALQFGGVPMREDYQVFVHFVDAQGQHRADMNADHSPPVSTSSWNGAVRYERAVSLPSDAPPGTYAIEVGLYQDHSPWGRVALAPGTGVRVNEGDSYVVGSLTIGTPPPKPNAITEVLSLTTRELTAKPGGALSLSLNFKAVPMPEDDVVFVHFVDASGQHPENMNADHDPPTPTSSWTGSVSYVHEYVLPSTAAPGTYEIRIGLYQNHSPWNRVELGTGPDVSVDDQLRYRVGTLVVAPP